MIKTIHLDKYFNKRKKNEIHVLNDISIEFPEKGLMVLLGASGSGKTTLLNVLGGLDKVESGTIEFFDKSLKGYRSNQWDDIRNEDIGYIFQNYNLLPQLSVYDNVAFVLKMLGIKDKEDIDVRVSYILKAVNMYPFRKKKALQLSGGQQQRVAIARALVKNPKVIIADEPTGNLDSKNTLEIMNIIKSISKEKLVILVTHEKQIASVYADRIIRLKDGVIESDELNEGTESHELDDQETIYLKDLQQLDHLDGNTLDAKIYTDQADERKVTATFIIRNKTLYLDIQADYKNIRLLNEQSNISIKDAHFEKKSKDELLETTFNNDILDTKDIKKEGKLLISLKQTLFMALQKVLKTSRKGKLLLFSFLLAGAIIALAAGMFSATFFIRVDKYLEHSKGYLRVEGVNLPTLEKYIKIGDNLDSFVIGSSENIRFELGSNENTKLTFYSNFETIETVPKSFVKGKIPASDSKDVVITTTLADRLIDYDGQKLGFWDYDDLMAESFSNLGDIKIAGIVKSEMPMVYVHKEMNYLNQSHPIINDSMYPLADFNQNNLLFGQIPNDDSTSILISETSYENLFYQELDDKTEFPIVYQDLFSNKVFTIAGVHNQLSGVYLGYNGYLSAMTTLEPSRVLLYAKNTQKLVENIMSSGLISDERYIINHYDTIYDMMVSIRSEQIKMTLIVTLFLLGFTLVGFYFVIRSSMMSRIYEISVHRALGVKKKNIFLSFFVEIIVITTISTLVGYILLTIGLAKLQQGSDYTEAIFYITPLGVIGGIIAMYVINVLAGLMPVYLLLRKTPAQILSQYDM